MLHGEDSGDEDDQWDYDEKEAELEMLRRELERERKKEKRRKEQVPTIINSRMVKLLPLMAFVILRSSLYFITKSCQKLWAYI